MMIKKHGGLAPVANSLVVFIDVGNESLDHAAKKEEKKHRRRHDDHRHFRF